MVSNPISSEWVAELEPPEATGGESHSALYVVAGEGPPPHYHVGCEETFEVLDGELTVVVGGIPHRVRTGETHSLDPGTVHKPRSDGDGFAAAVGTVRPPAKTLDLIMTQFGLTHEGKVSATGRPGFLQAMVMTTGFADDTVFATPPPAVVRPLAAVLAPVGRLLGYRPTYPRYETWTFWQRHVEQPDL